MLDNSLMDPFGQILHKEINYFPYEQEYIILLLNS